MIQKIIESNVFQKRFVVEYIIRSTKGKDLTYSTKESYFSNKYNNKHGWLFTTEEKKQIKKLYNYLNIINPK